MIAHTPLLYKRDWALMNDPTTDHDNGPGGWLAHSKPQPNMYMFYRHEPTAGISLKLWNSLPNETPQPVPDPPGHFRMDVSEWDKVRGGQLMGNRNWISVPDPLNPGATIIYEIVSVQVGGSCEVFAVPI